MKVILSSCCTFERVQQSGQEILLRAVRPRKPWNIPSNQRCRATQDAGVTRREKSPLCTFTERKPFMLCTTGSFFEWHLSAHFCANGLNVKSPLCTFAQSDSHEMKAIHAPLHKGPISLDASDLCAHVCTNKLLVNSSIQVSAQSDVENSTLRSCRK